MTELRRSNAAGFHPDRRTRKMRSRNAQREGSIHVNLTSWYDDGEWTDYEPEWMHFGTGG